MDAIKMSLECGNEEGYLLGISFDSSFQRHVLVHDSQTYMFNASFLVWTLGVTLFHTSIRPALSEHAVVT